MKERNFNMAVLPALFSGFPLACHILCRHFLKLPNFSFLPSFHIGRYSASGCRPVWLLSKFSVLLAVIKHTPPQLLHSVPLAGVGWTSVFCWLNYGNTMQTL